MSGDLTIAEIGRAALAADGYWAVNKVLVRELGVETAFFLTYLISLNENLSKNNGWFYRTEDTRLRDTGIGHKTQRTIVNQLRSLKLIRTKRVGLPPRTHFKIDYQAVMNYLHHVSHRANPADWGELIRPEGHDSSGTMGSNNPAGPAGSILRNTNKETQNKKGRNQPCGVAVNISQTIYGKLNPRAPQKIKKGAIAIEAILQEGYAPQDVRAALLWAIDQEPDPQGDFPGWGEVLRTRPGNYLTLKRKQKNNTTPFETIFNMWEGRDTPKRKPQKKREGLPPGYFDDYERRAQRIVVRRGKQA